MSDSNLCRVVRGEPLKLTTLQELTDIGLPMNQSSLADLLSCRRLYLLKHKWGLRFKGTLESSGATRIGSLAHELFERGPDSVEDVRRDVTETQKNLMKQVGEGNDMFGDLASAASSLEAEFQKALVMVRIFWERYPASPDIEILGKEVYVETTIDTPDGTPLDIYGTMDEVDRHIPSRRLWIRDKKTTGVSLDFHSAGEEWSLQSLFYPMLCEAEYAEIPFGFIYDRIQVPTIKFCGKDKDFNAYLTRVKKWYENNCDRSMVSRAIVHTYNNGVELDEALRVAVAYKLNRGLDPDDFPRDPTQKACKPFINKTCPYLGICKKDQASWPDLFNAACVVCKEKNNAPKQ